MQKLIRNGKAPSRRVQRGTSLLEVLIAVLILAIGMLGMAALQSITLKNSNSSSGRSQAVMQSYSLLDTLRLNRQLANAGAYNVTSWSCATQAPATGDKTDYSVFNGWLAQVQASLGDPSACGRLQCAPDPADVAVALCTVGIKWDDSRASSGGVVGDKELEIETTSRL